MADDISLVLTIASGLFCMVLGLYVFLRGRRQTVNLLFFLICIFMVIWCLGEAMTVVSDSLAAKTFWTRFQGLGEMPLIPTYLLLAHYFTSHEFLKRDWRKRAVLLVSLYAPWLVGLVLLYTTSLIYSSYYLIEKGQGINVVRTPFFWFLTALGFAEILAASVIYLAERRRTSVKIARKGLLILALAPVPMLAVNIIMNLELSFRVTTPQAGILFIGMVGYGILRYGLFVDIRSVARNMLAHAMVVVGNLMIFTLLCVFYIYGMDMGLHWTTYALFVLTGIPFMIAYHTELEWARKFTARHIYGREFEEGLLLQELGSSIRTVSNVDELAESVVHRVRESMGMSACALMLSEDGGYRVVGYDASEKHPAGVFSDTITANTFMLEWENAYSTYTDKDRYTTFWHVGNRIFRGQCVLEFIDVGFLRIYEGGGRVREIVWRDEEEGEVVSIPLEIHGERVGLLWFGGKLNGARFTLEEFDFMVTLSNQLSISLLNSKLVQELLDKSARLQKLIQSTSSAQEEERIRISRELHDGLAPYFLDFIFRLDMLDAQAAGFPDLSSSLEELRTKAREGLRDLRLVIGDLRPSSLDVLGLEKSLSTYLERFAAENGIAVEFLSSGDLEHLDSLTEVTIFRVAQEALSNVARHAGAARIRFMLKGDNGWVEMMVEDDGAGFSEREVRERMIVGECLGIRGMRERAELMQGDLVIDSRPGDGTKVCLSFPVRRL